MGRLQQVAPHVGFLPDKSLKVFVSLTGIKSAIFCLPGKHMNNYTMEKPLKSHNWMVFIQRHINFKNISYSVPGLKLIQMTYKENAVILMKE